ncbi:hypothetical protein SAMN04490202_0470 [Pseudomonas reinekei]|uniref:BrnT family toxin n=1 Tax=Pseudomonas reinekei TaxID=395598 RepID=A0A1H0ICG6_PSERE|nr:hypothetical protein SAMN04490202_0470 [Pseudomonas reinekei]
MTTVGRARLLQYTYKVCIIKSFEIQCHKAKNAANKLKHQGISLAETEPVFHDEHALTFQDEDHDEQRWITMGLDGKGHLLVVAYTYRDPNFVRIISVRPASKAERSQYLEA